MVKNYIPKKGDLVILSFDPSSGHKQQGRRAALIISRNLQQSPNLSNSVPNNKHRQKLPLQCRNKKQNLTGYIMCEQIKSIDYKARQVKFVEKLDEESLNKVLGITESIIF